MSDQSHRGGKAPTPFTPSVDRRILELDEALRHAEVFSGAIPGTGTARDSTRVRNAMDSALGTVGTFVPGVVIHALPDVNWYKVQAGDGRGWIKACLLAPSSLTPLGVRPIDMAQPNDNVLVYIPPKLDYGFIVGVIPPLTLNAGVLLPDFVSQGGGSGIRRESGHKYPIKNLYNSGGVIDWSAQRPMDQTPADRGWITSFGLAFTIDDYMMQMRVNESAGIWMTLFDGWVRIAGEHLVIESPVHETEAVADEGESRLFTGVATYVHEALGQYAAGQSTTEQYDDKSVQYDIHKGTVDLKTGEEDVAPIYRQQEYAGYLGQGGLRFVMAPAATAGSKRYSANTSTDYGLFMESIGLDGGYSLVSAKSVHIGKRTLIPVPQQKAPVQSAKGDDATVGGYRYSSLYGTGPEHKIGDILITGDVQSMTRATCVLDIIAYNLNWKALHPFHYHIGDYSLPQASQMPNAAREAVDYTDLASGFCLADPKPKKIVIDHRYGGINYYARESFIKMHEDGTVHISGGGGEEIVLGGGHVFINSPGGIHVRSGTDVTTHAAQVVVKAKGSIDLSSTDGDVRLKAEKNMQFLAGNSGRGGMLLQSNGAGSIQQYENRFGEDVLGSGIVLRASNSTAAVLGKDVYLRTGGTDIGEGDILLDASRGKQRVQIFSREFHAYTSKGITFNFGPLEESSTVRRTYFFGENTLIADVKLLLGGKLIGYNGGGGSAGIVVDGGVFGTKSFATAGRMADNAGALLGKIPGNFAGTVSSTCNNAAAAVGQTIADATDRHQTTVVNKYYQAGQLGADDTIAALSFSFRDPPTNQNQYGTTGFIWPEALWQQSTRIGNCIGGEPWIEKPVLYQGQETYPWPGKTKWVDEDTFLRTTFTTLFDAAAGVDNDRPGQYEEPQLNTEQIKPDGNYTLIK